MNELFNRPKSFGEILDHTFRLSKNRFSDFFKILLFIVGPVYLLQAIVQMLTGMSFLREGGSGDIWYEQFMTSFNENAPSASLGADLVLMVVGLATFLLFPIAQASIIYTVDYIRKNEEYTVGMVIKKAFSRFGPIIGSSLLFGLIVFGAIIVPLIVIGIVGVAGAAGDVVTGIIIGGVLFLALLIVVALFLTRLSFYLAAVVLDGEVPGLGKSWQLTKKQTWKLFGLYLVLYIIIGCITVAAEALFGIFLGNSVLFTLLVNLVTLFTTMILSVGYAVMYLDLKVRHDADDLEEMIETYQEDNW